MNATTSINTIGGMVAPGPLAWSPPTAPRKRRWLLVGIPSGLLVVVLTALSFVPLPYIAIEPGSAEPINSLLSVPADRSHPPTGRILLTTVSLRDVRGIDVVRGWLNPDIDILPERVLLGDSTPTQYSEAAQQEMSDSKQAAEVLALRRIGFPVPEHGEGALVTTLTGPSVPVSGVLAAGDAITAIDGVATPLQQDAIGILQRHHAGDTVKASVVKASGASEQASIRLGSRAGDQCVVQVDTALGACLGVVLGTKAHRFDYPFNVKIDTAGIGGPSAGLAFTLALLDQLTPGELTGGRAVAVTGTIDFNGVVGDVGGVAQKTAAVRASGAKFFLVPPGEFKTASARAGKHLKVIEVRTLDEAIAALASIGGDTSGLVPAKGR